MLAGAFAIFLALLVLLVAVISARNSITALRLGSFTNRNGLQISRVESPVLFWISISLGLGVPVIVLCLSLLVASIWVISLRIPSA
jgi:hypothetical protein